MSETYDYPAEVTRDEDGRFVVVFPDFGWGATDGATRDEALAEARDLLRELIAATMREGKGLPEPSRDTRGRPLVVPTLPIAHRNPLHAPAATRRQAIQEHLDDLEDLHIAEQRLIVHRAGESAAMPLHEVMKRYGMDD